jgi:hypothetical protein
MKPAPSDAASAAAIADLNFIVISCFESRQCIGEL